MRKGQNKNIYKSPKWGKQMKKSKAIIITGHREAMEPYSARIPKGESKILKRTARANKCTCAAMLRTAWSEYIINHELN
jgi:hypothetical protein